MDNENEVLFDGLNAAYRIMRRRTDMDDAREWLVRKLRQAADDIEAGRIQPDGTPIEPDPMAFGR